MLSFVQATFASRPQPEHRASDDVINTSLFLTVICAISAAALRRPRKTTRTADITLNLSFFALSVAIFVFAWCNMNRGPAIILTAFAVLLVLAYMTFTDPDAEGGKKCG
jgi:Ca2+/Na+ antiporter